MTARDRIASLDWPRLGAELTEQGFAIVPSLLSDTQCADMRSLYPNDIRFRSTVVMARYGFGRGEYRYLNYPLPDLIAIMRAAFYSHLADIANAWAGQLGDARRFPADHARFIAECAAAGQSRPTPLLLRYGPGDYNCLHQDLYGDVVFPIQIAILLSEPGEDFEGGEFVMTEQRPRRQSRVSVAPLKRGDAVIFAVNTRPQQGSRGVYRVATRHGVSTLRSGERYTLGVIFHDAK